MAKIASNWEKEKGQLVDITPMCPACQSANYEKTQHARQIAGLELSFPLFRCRDCGWMLAGTQTLKVVGKSSYQPHDVQNMKLALGKLLTELRRSELWRAILGQHRLEAVHSDGDRQFVTIDEVLDFLQEIIFNVTFGDE